MLKTIRSSRPYYWLLYNWICKGLDCRDIAVTSGKNRLPFISISFFCGGQCEYSRVTNTVSTSPFWVASSVKTLHMFKTWHISLTRIAIWATPSWMIFVVLFWNISLWDGGPAYLVLVAMDSQWGTSLENGFLVMVDGFKRGFYFPYYEMSSQPHWRSPSFFKMVIAPPTRNYLVDLR